MCAMLGTIAAILTVLPLFGLDLRIRKRSNTSEEILASPKGRREKRLWVAVAVALLSVALSGASFYRLYRPRIVEKIIEKPVEKIVEKKVPQDCTKPASTSEKIKGPT